MKLEHTERGFERINFRDRNGNDCSLQQSSAIGDVPNAMGRPGASYLWIGRGPDRMHLDPNMVRELVHRMIAWLDTGSLRVELDPPEKQ